jgi:tripartite-type tricarboxylate transporter receptor subunit TctC
MLAAPACAQTWPSKPVRVIIPFPAGGTADTLGRIATQKLSEAFGQKFVPENKPGASGLIALNEAAKAAPDGYTLFVSSVGGLLISSALSPHPPADPVTGYTHIAYFGGPPAVVVLNNNVPAHSLKEFVAYAKSKPGVINYGAPNPGSHSNLIFTLFQRQAGINLTLVPYKGATFAVTDLLGGHIAITATTLTTIAGQITGGKVRPIAISSAERLPSFKEIPTFKELGYPDLVAEAWFALSGPKGIPPAIAKRINEEVIKGFRDPQVRARLDREAIHPHPYSPAEFTAFLKAENEKWPPLAKSAGAKLE